MYVVEIKEKAGNLHNAVEFKDRNEARTFEAIAKEKVFESYREATIEAAKVCPMFRKSSAHAFSVLHPHDANPYGF